MIKALARFTVISAVLFAGSALAEPTAKATYQDVQNTLGLVPSFVKAFPEDGVAGAWDELKAIQLNPNTALSTKQKELIGLAVNYARDFVAPTLKRRAPTEMEAEALRDLDNELAKLPPDSSAEEIQTQVFEVGKRHPFESLRGWFQALYETLLGSSQGPRMGSFIALYGINNSRKLIAEALTTAS